MSKEKGKPSLLRLQASNLVDLATHAWSTSSPPEITWIAARPPESWSSVA